MAFFQVDADEIIIVGVYGGSRRCRRWRLCIHIPLLCISRFHAPLVNARHWYRKKHLALAAGAAAEMDVEAARFHTARSGVEQASDAFAREMEDEINRFRHRRTS